jgi:hypothetical protein
VIGMMLLAEAQLSDKTRDFIKYMHWDFNENRGTPTQILYQIGLVILALVALFGILFVLGVFQTRSSDPVARQSRRLFRWTLGKLGLSAGDRALLHMVARASGLKHPAAMLLSPEMLERSGRRWADRVLVTPLRNMGWRRLSALSRELHGRPLPDFE